MGINRTWLGSPRKRHPKAHVDRTTWSWVFYRKITYLFCVIGVLKSQMLSSRLFLRCAVPLTVYSLISRLTLSKQNRHLGLALVSRRPTSREVSGYDTSTCCWHWCFFWLPSSTYTRSPLSANDRQRAVDLDKYKRGTGLQSRLAYYRQSNRGKGVYRTYVKIQETIANVCRSLS